MDFVEDEPRWWKKWGRKGLSKKSKATGTQPTETEQLLDRFFEPHNHALYELIRAFDFPVNMTALMREFRINPARSSAVGY